VLGDPPSHMQAWYELTFTCNLAGVALMAQGSALGLGLGARDPASFAGQA